jgi:hypothetical protein
MITKSKRFIRGHEIESQSKKRFCKPFFVFLDSTLHLAFVDSKPWLFDRSPKSPSRQAKGEQ